MRIISADFSIRISDCSDCFIFCKLRFLSPLLLQCSFLFPDEVHLVLADSACAIQSVHVCQKPDLRQNN